MKRERRLVSTEFRMVGEGNGPTKLAGYAAVFNSDSEDLGGFIETIMPGAFSRSLATGPDVVCLFNHDPNNLLGRTPNTLSITQDAKGLRYVVEPPDTQLGRDIPVLVQRGDLKHSSFAFIARRQRWLNNAGQEVEARRATRREIIEAELTDVSPVVRPAYSASSVGLEARAAFLFPDGAPEGRDHINSGSGPAPKEYNAYLRWWQERTVAANEQRIRAAEEIERARIDAELRLSARERRERRIRERMAELDKQAHAEYRRRDEERRKEIEGRCKVHGRFSCLTCHPPQWSGAIIS
jgi:HK97 family phage prohead protease